MATSQLVSVYYVELDSHSLFQDIVHGYTVSVDERKYDIDFTDDIQTWLGNDWYGVIAINNGYVHPLYKNSYGTGYAYDYRVKNNVFFGDEVMDSWIIYVTTSHVSTGNYWRPADLIDAAVETRIKFGNGPYDTFVSVEEDDETQFLSISITEGLMSESFFSYGSTYSPNCNIVMTKCEYAVPGVWFRVEFKVDGVWQCFGVFKINSIPTKTSEEISFSGAGILESVFQNAQIQFLSSSIPNFIYYSYESTGIPVIIDFEDEVLENNSLWNSAFLTTRQDAIETNEAGVVINASYHFSLGDNFREAWSNFAAALHSNLIERNGVIHMVHIKSDVPDDAMRFLFDASQYMEEPSDMGYYYYASPIKVEVNQSRCAAAVLVPSGNISSHAELCYMGNTATPTIMSETMSDEEHTMVAYPLTISAEPLWYYATHLSSASWGGVDQMSLSFREIVTEVLGFDKDVFAYKPFSVDFMGYHPCLFPGSRIAIDKGDTIDYMALVGNVTLTYDGTLSVQIDTPCDVQIGGINGASSGSSGALGSSGIAAFTSFVLGVQDASVIKDKAITGSKIADSTITSTQIADSTITGSKIADSTITNSNILRGSLYGSSFADGTIEGSKIADSTIEGSKIKNTTISGSKIDFSTFQNGVISGTAIDTSTFTDGQISGTAIDTSTFTDGTISGSKITNSTITGSKIVDGTLDGSTKIEDATITYAKMDSSFISDLTSETAYINNLKSNVANINTLTANDAIIQNIFSNSIISNSAILNTLQSNIISAEYIRSAVASIGYLTADDADVRYADIELANIDIADIGRFYADSGILTDVLIQDGNVTGTLNGVRINADVITTGTLSVDRLLVTGENSIVYQINVDSSGLSKSELSKEVYQKYLNGTDIVANSITATQITAGTITANELNIANIFGNQAVINQIFARDVTATGTITGATLNGATITSRNGTIGGWTIGQSSIYATSGSDTLSLNSSGANIVGTNTDTNREYSLNTQSLTYLNATDNTDYCSIGNSGVRNATGNTVVSLTENGHVASSVDEDYRYIVYSAVSEQNTDAHGLFVEKRDKTNTNTTYEVVRILSNKIHMTDNNSYTSGSLTRDGGEILITLDNPWSASINPEKSNYIKIDPWWGIYVGDTSDNDSTTRIESSNVTAQYFSTNNYSGNPQSLNNGYLWGGNHYGNRVQINKGYIAFADAYSTRESGSYSNSQGWIRMTGASSSSSEFEFAVGNGTATEKIVFRKYNSSSEVSKEFVLLDEDGNTIPAGYIQMGINPIYANNGTSYGIKWGRKNSIVGATSSATANRTGLIIGQVGSESSSYGAMIFGASSYIYTKGSLVLNTTGSVAANDNRAITGNKINEYFNSIGSNYFRNIIDTSNTIVNVLDNTRTNIQSYTFPSGTYIISCYAEFGTQAAYNNQGIRQIVLSSSSGGEAIDLTCVDQQMPNPVYYAGKVHLSFTTILRFTADKSPKRYLVAWQKSGETLPVTGRIKALRLGD